MASDQGVGGGYKGRSDGQEKECGMGTGRERERETRTSTLALTER